MALETNSHVERLARFQPFNPDAAELVHEQATTRESGYPTTSRSYVRGLLDRADAQLIVLTGDAGHGKTHLCGEILQDCGAHPSTAQGLIKSLADGRHELARTPGGRPLRVVKDLSEFDIPAATSLLVELLRDDSGAITLVCANEGRLRRAAAGHEALSIFTETLELGMDTGSCSTGDGRVYLVNLNYQSVAPDEGVGLVEWALREWAADKRRWRACGRCDAQSVCPIFANHRMLSEKEAGAVRRRRIRQLLATTEQAGTIVTFRQALAVIAYSITGGLRCGDVHRRWSQGRTNTGWQWAHLYHQAVFGELLTRQQRRDLSTIHALRRLDPGTIATRGVDDLLEPDPEDGFTPPSPSLDGAGPRSRKDAERESEQIRRLMVFLRRRAFFDTISDVDPLARLGLHEGSAFSQAATGALASRREVRLRDTLLRGLEASQGFRRGGDPPDLLILDPAFVNHRSRAAVVGRRIHGRQVVIDGQVGHWQKGGQEPELVEAVDWLSRVAYVTIPDDVHIPLDLFRFELLLRWARGLSARAEHAAQQRLLNGLLARVVPQSPDEDEIVVLVEGTRRTLSIDVGDRVRSGQA